MSETETLVLVMYPGHPYNKVFHKIDTVGKRVVTSTCSYLKSSLVEVNTEHAAVLHRENAKKFAKPCDRCVAS